MAGRPLRLLWPTAIRATICARHFNLCPHLPDQSTKSARPRAPPQLDLWPVDLWADRLDVTLARRWPLLTSLTLQDDRWHEEACASATLCMDGAAVYVGGDHVGPALVHRWLYGLLEGFILPR